MRKHKAQPKCKQKKPVGRVPSKTYTRMWLFFTPGKRKHYLAGFYKVPYNDLPSS